MNRYKSLILAVLLLSFLSCEKTEERAIVDPKPIILPEKGNEVICKSNDFGINLFRISSVDEQTNLMLSPLSASIALTMLLNGCNNETYNQIHQMLGYDNLSIEEVNLIYKKLRDQLLKVDSKVDLAIANAVFYRQDFVVKPAFLDSMESVFSSHIEGLDFSVPAALTIINGWASDNTHGKIPMVLSEISNEAVMFLMNALYFKGKWTTEFKKESTAADDFYLDDGSVLEVDMMKGDVLSKFFFEEGYRVAELPYGRSNFTMVVIIPDGTLNSLIENFDATMWSNVTTQLDEIANFSTITLNMPIFKFSYEQILNNQLMSLGMNDAFDPEKADLTGISDAGIYVNFVKQNTFVDVNEEGTEAAAVTTIGIYATSSGSPTYKINKPFIFVIRERTTNTLLFIGKVVDPTN